MHNIFSSSEPVGALGMLKSQQNAYLPEPSAGWWYAKSQPKTSCSAEPVRVGGNAKNHNLNAQYLNSA
jgi:hypothetical protein